MNLWKFLKEHSLSIGLGLTSIIFFFLASFTDPQQFLGQILIGIGCEFLGLLGFVIYTKYFREKDSPESKDVDE